MNTRLSIAVILFSLTALQPTPAHAVEQWYPLPGKIFTLSERTATLGSGSSLSLIEALLMGVQGYDSTHAKVLPNPFNVNSAELLNLCHPQTVDAEAWFEDCNSNGMKPVLATKYNQNWITRSFDDKDLALRAMLQGLINQNSPIVVPLFGQADHWATIYKIKGDTALNPWKVTFVTYYDAGAPSSKELLPSPNNPDLDNDWIPDDGFDYLGNQYEDGPKTKTATNFKDQFYFMFSPEPANMFPNPAYKGKYIFIYEPPNALINAKVPDIVFEPATPLVDPDEGLGSDLAAELALDALAIEGFDSEPGYREVMMRGVAWEAFEVMGTYPSGESWRYYLVPVVDAGTDETLALVSLSAVDGSLIGSQLLTRPKVHTFRDVEEAQHLAEARLRPGESLRGGALVWDSLCGKDHCRAPERPYYEYGAIPADAPRGTSGRPIIVTLY